MSDTTTPHRLQPLANCLMGVPFALIHLGCLAAFFVPFSWSLVAAAVALYVVRMWAITAGYHRYFSHRAFKTSRAFQFLLAFLAQTSLQKGALWWAAHHRHHHRHSDDAEDLHSPRQRGFLWSHMGWFLSSDHHATRFELVKDFARYPELRFMDRWHWVPPALYAALLYAVGGLPLFVWGFVVSTVALWHGTFVINSLAHVFGSRRYTTADDSRNNLFFAIITLGEGWHNNHHHYQSSANQGFFWWEVDVTFYVLKAMERLGLVWDLRRPPESALARTEASAHLAETVADAV